MKFRRLYPIIILTLLASPVFSASVTYRYDELDRLKEVTFENGKNIVYEYDQIGNMITKTGPPCADGYDYNAGRGRCEFSPSTCVNGASYNTATNRCETLPSCGSGTYSAASNQCVSASSYAATGTGSISYNIKIGYEPAKTYSCASNITVGYRHILMYGSGCGQTENVFGYVAPPGTPGFIPVGLDMLGVVNYGALYCSFLDGAKQDVHVYPQAAPGTNCAYYIQGSVSPSPFPGSAAFPGGGYYSPVLQTVTTYTCPSGGTLSGITCTTATYTAASCPSGTSLDTAADRCVANQACAGGSYDATNDVCYVASH